MKNMLFILPPTKMPQSCEKCGREDAWLQPSTENTRMAEEEMRAFLLETFVYRDDLGRQQRCFDPTRRLHSVLVVEDGQACWLYGGDLSAEAKAFFVQALESWCEPPSPG